MRAIRYGIVCASLSLMAMAGCGDENEEGHEELSVTADACEHMIEGPGQTLSAIADAAGDAPDVEGDHERFDVTLAGDGSMRAGYLDLVIPHEGDHAVFLSADVPVTLRDPDGNEVAAEETWSTVDDCTEVAVGYGYLLSVGTYSLSFGPTDAGEVQLVLLHTHADGDHGH